MKIADMEFISDEEFNTALTDTAEAARAQLARQDEQDFTPSLFTCEWQVDEDGTLLAAHSLHVFLGFDMNNRREILRDLGVNMGRKLDMVRAVFFLSEAWVSKRPDLYRLPEQDPDRTEIIIIAGMSADGRCNHGRVQVTRDANNMMVPGEIELRRYGADPNLTMRNKICEAFFVGYREGIMEALALRLEKADSPT